MAEHADLVVLTEAGPYCPAGDFHIDPGRPVARAVFTHAHADHARRGHGACLAHRASAGVLRQRLGAIALQTLEYGEGVDIGGVRVSLHPAGHILGSAQVRLEHRGRVWVVSGDYFVSGAGDTNPTCTPFEPVRCDVFVTESTFALPVYRWRPQAEVLAELNAWWRANADAGCPSVLDAYSLGKAQRVLAGIDAGIGPIVVHDTVAAINEAYRAEGFALPATRPLREADEGLLRRALVIVPPGARQGDAADRLRGARRAFASGWMQLRRARQRQGMDRGFVLSDHADWPGLLSAIEATGAERVLVTHGHEAVLQRFLGDRGRDARVWQAASGHRPG